MFRALKVEEKVMIKMFVLKQMEQIEFPNFNFSSTYGVRITPNFSNNNFKRRGVSQELIASICIPILLVKAPQMENSENV